MTYQAVPTAKQNTNQTILWGIIAFGDNQNFMVSDATGIPLTFPDEAAATAYIAANLSTVEIMQAVDFYHAAGKAPGLGEFFDKVAKADIQKAIDYNTDPTLTPYIQNLFDNYDGAKLFYDSIEFINNYEAP